MGEKKYRVIENIDCPYEKVIAQNLDLDIALLLLKAYCEEYFNEQISLTIKEEDKCCSNEINN